MNNDKQKNSPYNENLALLSAYRDGDEDAGERFVTLNTPLVYGIAGRFSGRGADMSDLLECGHIGLVKAMRTFDFSRECVTIFSSRFLFSSSICKKYFFIFSFLVIESFSITPACKSLGLIFIHSEQK